MLKEKNGNTIYLLFFDASMFLYIFFSVLGYTELSVGAGMAQIFIQVLIIGIWIWNVNIYDYLFLWPLVVAVGIIPLIMILLGVYSFFTAQNLEYIIFFIFNLMFICCIVDRFKNNIQRLIELWFWTLNIVLGMLMFLYRGISLNLSFLLQAMISNQRYGNNIIQRYGMGFKNVNTMALFAVILIVCSIYLFFKRKYRAFTILDVVFGIVLIINAESRAPLLVLFGVMVLFFIRNIKGEKTRRIFSTLYLVIVISFTVLFVVLLFCKNSGNYLYTLVDEISSYRLSFGTQAIEFVRSHGSTLFGVGPLSSSYITNNIFNMALTLDNSIEYYLFTLGWIGLFIVYTFLAWCLYKIMSVNRLDNRFAICIFDFYFLYSIFENTIFIPKSLLSLFCLTVILIYVLKSNKTI